MTCDYTYSLADGDCDLNSGDTAWLLFATTFVMLQTPATGLAQAGLVRRKNAVSLIAQSVIGVAWGSVLWMLIGYSLTFGPSQGGVIGNADFAFLVDVPDQTCLPTYSSSVPALLHVSFQMMFAIMVPVLVTGAWAEKFSFKAFMIFITLWPFFVYYPIAHWVWNVCGWMLEDGVVDFAGGITIHTPAGVSALVVTYMMTGRKRHSELTDTAHSVPLMVMGASLVWAGWYSFNGGSALAANAQAAQALLNTQMSASTGAMAWLFWDYMQDGKARATGAIAGALAGLAGVTPGSGFQDVQTSFLCGVLVGSAAWYTSRFIKNKLKKDDVLDVFSLQAVPGFLGSVFVGFSADVAVFIPRDDPNNPTGPDPSIDFIQDDRNGIFFGGNGRLLGVQLMAAIISAVWTAFWTWVLMLIIKYTVGIEISADVEERGLDEVEYEPAYDNVIALERQDLASKSSHLIEAATNGDVDEVKRLLKLGVDPSRSDYDGRTPLHLAAANGHCDILKILLKHEDVVVDAKDRFGGTALSDAIISGQDEAVKVLVSAGASMNASENFASALLDAAAEGDVGTLQRMINAGVDVSEIKDYDRRTPLHLAAGNGQRDAVAVLRAAGARSDAVDRWDRTPLQDAQTYVFTDIMQLLKMKPEDVKLPKHALYAKKGAESVRDSVSVSSRMSTGDREMLDAAAAGDLKEIKRLLKKKTSPVCADYDGRTPLHVAAAGGHLAVVKVLASRRGVNINAMDRWHHTPLQDAAAHEEVRLWLRQHGACVVDRKVGYELCHAAAIGNVSDLIKAHRAGADLNCADYDGRTALHLAASEGQLEVVEWLIRQEVNVNSTDRYGNTPLVDARRSNFKNVADFLVSHGGSEEGSEVKLTDAEEHELISASSFRTTDGLTNEDVSVNVE